MATSTTLTSGQRAAHGIALGAAAVDTVTFPRWVPEVEITSHSTSAIYFTVDGSTPTVGGAGTHVLPPAVSTRTVKTPRVDSPSTQARGVTVVKLISAGTPTYSVSEA